MRKTILFLVFILSINLGFSQQTITISSGCETQGYHGNYLYSTDTNGKPDYVTSNPYDCTQYDIQTNCEALPSFQFSIFWNGTNWVILKTKSCRWDFGTCVPNPVDANNPPPNSEIIATNTNDTPLPPCTGWIFTPPALCEPTFSNCTTLGVNENGFNNKFKAYPNPAENNYTIKFQDLNTFIKVDMVNTLGQVIWSKEYQNTTLINLELNQPSGVYYVKLTDVYNKSAYIKLIKK